MTSEEAARLADLARALGAEPRGPSATGQDSGAAVAALLAQLAAIQVAVLAQGETLSDTNETIKGQGKTLQDVLLQLARGSGRMDVIDTNVNNTKGECVQIRGELSAFGKKLDEHIQRCDREHSSGSRGSVHGSSRGEDGSGSRPSVGWISASALPKILLAVGSIATAIIGAFLLVLLARANPAPQTQNDPPVRHASPAP